MALLAECGCVALGLEYVGCVWDVGGGWEVESVFCVGKAGFVGGVVSVEGEGVLVESATSAFVYTGVLERS